jgi:hypothetical protein
MNGLIQKFIKMLRAVTGNIHSYFRHGFDRERMHMPSGFAAGARHIDQIAGGLAQNSLGQMTATGIPRA